MNLWKLFGSDAICLNGISVKKGMALYIISWYRKNRERAIGKKYCSTKLFTKMQR
uniref:Uncharacterized protein n=1 Tax=Arundo donax TaxID=35708 RepID=A0A0A9HFW1_ARUDO